MNKKTFKDLIVIELASVLAGPLTGMFFAELGATVIKIENKLTGGDVTRKWKLPKEKADAKISAYYASANWGKKSILLDLQKSTDRKKSLDLIRKADIVICNYKKGDAEKLGMSYTNLKKTNAKLIYGHISGYGEDDPRPAFDLVLQAETGFMSMNGSKESGPLKMPVALIDVLAAHQLKEGILTALYTRALTNKGCKVSVSLYDTAISSLANQGANYLNTGYIPGLTGSLHPNIAPYGELFKTKDGKYITLAVGTDKQFEELCLCLKLEKISKSRLYCSNRVRVKNRKKLSIIIQERLSVFQFKVISNLLLKHHVPFSEIKNLKDVFKAQNAQKLVLKGDDGYKTVKSAVFS